MKYLQISRFEWNTYGISLPRSPTKQTTYSQDI